MNIKAWVSAARPKTLPLAISGILTGSAIAYMSHNLNSAVMWFGIITALLLQILSNFANDYGDFKKGTDIQAKRTDRMLTSGSITEEQMKTVMVINSLLILISGIALLYSAHIKITIISIIFFLLGLAAIGAALNYTIGRRPMAYMGTGDVFVFIFFGFVSCAGIYYLHAFGLSVQCLLASAGVGFWSTAVLNTNNIRDLKVDKENHKKTFPVRFGYRKAMIYQRLLIWGGIVLILLSLFYYLFHLPAKISFFEYALLTGVFSPFMIIAAGHTSRLSAAVDSDQASGFENENERRNGYNKELKIVSLSTLMISIMYWVIAVLIY